MFLIFVHSLAGWLLPLQTGYIHIRKAWDITLVATQALVNLLPQQIMPTQNVGVYLFALREFEIYQTSCCKAKAKRFLNILKNYGKDSDYLPCLHKEAARTDENTSFIGSCGSFSGVGSLYMSLYFVQGYQFAVRHVGDEGTVREDTLMKADVVGVGLQEGLPGFLVDDLQGDALDGRRGGVGRQLHQLLQ